MFLQITEVMSLQTRHDQCRVASFLVSCQNWLF